MRRGMLWMAVWVCVAQSSSAAAGAAAATAEPVGQAGAEETVRALPSLDELLGLVEPSAGADAPRGGAEALDRTLREENPRAGFERASALMEDAAARLNERADASIETQRIQREILTRLDEAIAQAGQQPQSPSSGSSSSSQRQSQPAQPQASQQSGEQDAQASGEPGDGMRGGDTATNALETATPEAAAWGALPERLRGQLLQGLSDRYSALYQRTTEEYYRRLAEEAGR